ncbi:MAG: recombinase family protein [Acutalibacteraceae bacterium]
MKRVYCLYRVSTKKQVSKVMDYGGVKDDIPMQKQACREFADSHGWVIVKEFEEKGVSGFKVSAKNRDAIQDLKEAALREEFNILLVFMFDRIGRIDDETPFVVEWFVKHGIEVWSAREGEQRFDSHVDKLTNYIRFWQASGESEKTSMRIKTRMHQLTLDGVYTGGPVPFGYKLVGTGKKNRKGYEINNLQIEEGEAEIVRMIFSKVRCDGYGSYRIAQILNDGRVKTHKGSKFQSTTILRILRNRIYTGYLVSGDAVSPYIPELHIIDNEEFEAVQFILNQRSRKDEEKRQIAMNTKGKAMLSGNIFCAHCGHRLTTICYQDKYERRDGTVNITNVIKYSCYHKSRKLCECDGATTYRADQVDAIVTEFMKKLFDALNNSPDEELLERAFKRQNDADRANRKKAEQDLQKSCIQLEELQLEIGRSLTGDSIFSKADLSTAIQTLKLHIDECKKQLSEFEVKEEQGQEALEKFRPAFSRFKSWAEEFENATLEQKKMIAGQLFRRVEVGKGYKVHIVMNMTYQQFCEQWQSLPELSAG